MFYIPKIDDYLKTFTDEEVKDFAAINFNKYFKSIKEEQNLKTVAKLLHTFLTTPDEVEKYVASKQSNSSDNYIHCYNVNPLNIFNPELQLINTKPMIENKFKKQLSELKKLKVQAILVLEYKKRKDLKILYSSAILIVSNLGIDEAFKSMHQSIMTKKKLCL